MREMDDVLNRYSRMLDMPGRMNLDLFPQGDWMPRVDIMETDDSFIIKMDLPEVKKEDVKVAIDDGVLSISGERHQEKEEKGKKYQLVERSYGIFQRSFSVPDNLDEAKVNASFKDGILTVTCGKKEQAKRKAIDVQVQ
jgi:HSP20 family protein